MKNKRIEIKVKREWIGTYSVELDFDKLRELPKYKGLSDDMIEAHEVHDSAVNVEWKDERFIPLSITDLNTNEVLFENKSEGKYEV